MFVPQFNSIYKKLLSLRTPMWHAHVAHMAKNINMVGALIDGGPGALGTPLIRRWSTPKS